MAEPRPPRLAESLVRRLLAVALPSDDLEALLGDLHEDHARRAEDSSPTAARRAYRREALAAIVRLLPAALGARPPRAPRREPFEPAASRLVDTVGRELRHAARRLRRQPGFAAVAIVTLALGIGAATAVFGMLDAVLLKPLPFDEPERLVHLWGYDTTTGVGRSNISYPDFEDFRDGAEGLESIVAYQPARISLVEPGVAPERIGAAFASHDLFETLGLRIAIGRDLEAADDRRGAEPVMVLSHQLWTRRYDADPDILGRRVRLGESERTIVGVAAPGAGFPMTAEAWAPVEPLQGTEERGVHNLRILGRLAPDAPIERVDQSLGAIAGRLETDFPRSNANRGARAESLHEALVGRQRPHLVLLFAAAGLLLVVACANIAGLLMERAIGRVHEVATRTALGASRGQIARSFLAEAALLAAGGVALGALLGRAGQHLLVRYGGDVPRIDSVAFDWRVLAFAATVSTVAAVVFSQAPLLEVWRRDLSARLGGAGRGSVGTERGRQRWRRGLVGAEIALAVVLVMGAGLLVRSFDRVLSVDLGFEPEKVLAAELELPRAFISDDWPETNVFFDTLRERLEALPGVDSAAAAHHHPAQWGWETSFTIEGRPAPASGHEPEASFRPVTEGYFETVGTRLLQGRVFDSRDRAAAPGVVVVNQQFVDTHLRGVDSPIGTRLLRQSWWIEEVDSLEIVGVVDNERFTGRDLEILPALYLLHRQHPTPAMTVLVRTHVDPLSLRDAVRDTIWSIDPTLPVDRMATLEELVGHRVEIRRFLAWLLSVFAVLALALAALGIYGVLAYATARRRRELGLRMALGADRGSILGLVVIEGLRLAAIGLTVGLLLSLALARFIERFLFEVATIDPATLTAVVVTLALAAALASFLPARRAASVDPSRALQEE